jgi:hypothetical protein
MYPQQIDGGIYVFIQLTEEVKSGRIRRYLLLNDTNVVSHDGNRLDRNFQTFYLYIKIFNPPANLTFH